jgi:hypothetical protein
MAGRYVVLEFNDSDSADAFVQNNHVPHQLGFNIRGMFLSPTKFCKCPDKQRQDVKNWARGRRSGIWLCRRCKRPSQFHQEGLLERLKQALGYNLLETDD